MSVPVQPTYTAAVGNGITTVFPFQFLLQTDTDLAVSINGAAPTIGFSVAGFGVPSGGSVTFYQPPPPGAQIVMRRVIALKRTTDYQFQGDLPAATINSDFDRVWMALQGAATILDSALKVPFPEGGDLVTVLPAAAARARKALIFDANGRVTVSADDYADQLAAVIANAAAAVAAAQNAATSQASASGSAATALSAAATSVLIQQALQLVLYNMGYAPPVPYGPGISITLPTQTVDYSGALYAPIAAALPFTTGGTFDPTKWRLVQNSNVAQGNTAYVSKFGSDSTGVVGNPQRPFRQIDGALTALAGIAGPVVVDVLNGTAADYLPATTDDHPGSLIRDNLTLRTSQRGKFSADCTSIAGVAIPGPFFVDSSRRSGFGWNNLGCDSGKTVTDRLYAGQGRDGLVIANLAQTAGITGMVGPIVDRPICLGRDDNVTYHSLLVETTASGVLTDALTCYNLHGAAYKSTGLLVRGGKHYRCNGEAMIVKGDAYAACNGGQFSDLTLGGSPEGTTPWFVGTDLAGLKINPQGAAVRNQQFSKTRITGVTFAVQFQMGGPNAENINLGDLDIESVAAVGVLIDGSGAVVDLNIGTLRMVDATAVAVAVGTNPTLLRTKIDAIRLLNSGGAFDMSASSQDLTIGLVQARSLLAGKYLYTLGTGRIRVGREEIEPGSLAQKWHPKDKPTYTAGWTTQVSGATDPTVNLEGGGVALYGRANNGNGAGGSTTIMQMPLVLGPGTPDASMRTTVRGQLSTGGGTPCTVGIVVGNGSGALVVAIETIDGAAPNMALLVWVELTGIRWTY